MRILEEKYQTVGEVFAQIDKNRQYLIEICLREAVKNGDIEGIKCFGKELTGVYPYCFLEVPDYCEVVDL